MPSRHGIEGRAACVGQWELFDSVSVVDHLEARTLCKQCPQIMDCERTLKDLLTIGPTSTYRGVQGTWAGKLFGRAGYPRPVVTATCGRTTGSVASSRDNGPKGTTNASRPRTNGVSAPVRGLAGRKDTTDS